MEAFKGCKYKCFNSFTKWCFIYNIKFANGKNIKNDNFIVSSDDSSTKYRPGRFIRNASEDIKKLTIKTLANVSDLNVCYYLKKIFTLIFRKAFLKKYIK